MRVTAEGERQRLPGVQLNLPLTSASSERNRPENLAALPLHATAGHLLAARFG